MPFELGRPLGAPNDAAFQKRVLLAALKLLESPSGPVLEDYPEEAPDFEDANIGWACPVDLSSKKTGLDDTQKLKAAFKEEMTQLRTWYDLSVKKRGRTTVGVSGIDLDEIGDFVSAFLDGGAAENPRDDIPLGLTLKFAVDDLKAYYFEAVSARPGMASPGSQVLADWFWGDTAAGKVVLAVKKSCAESEDGMLKLAGTMFLVPVTV